MKCSLSSAQHFLPEMPHSHIIMNTFVNGVFIAVNKHSSPLTDQLLFCMQFYYFSNSLPSLTVHMNMHVSLAANSL